MRVIRSISDNFSDSRTKAPGSAKYRLKWQPQAEDFVTALGGQSQRPDDPSGGGGGAWFGAATLRDKVRASGN